MHSKDSYKLSDIHLKYLIAVSKGENKKSMRFTPGFASTVHPPTNLTLNMDRSMVDLSQLNNGDHP